MADHYHVSDTQAGAIGKQATANNTTFNNFGSTETSANVPADQPVRKTKTFLQRVGQWLVKAAGALGLQALKKLIFKE
ncbi:hypothetical protein [Puia sp.]|jgi:hypothetical protein|uniref:hypothetical protein n=1 Tax=Puia sp. TaxID=2045100 RepID=UPI002F3E49C6